MPYWNSGWADNFYQIHGTVTDSEYSEDYIAQLRSIILNEIHENKDNRDKISSANYSVKTKGGKVTLTPIYHNSSSGDMISYYYYLDGTNPSVDDIKAMKKYTIGNICDPEECKGNDPANHMKFDRKTYTLVYVFFGIIISFIISASPYYSLFLLILHMLSKHYRV